MVKPGDTALSVSEKYKVDYDEMVAALEQCVGYTEGSFLNVGQSICLPPYFPSCKFVTATDPAADECKLYTVQQGDTMASIASSFNLYMHWMVNLNGEAVQPGQRIKLPPWYSRCPSMESATNPPCRVYNVKNGDTMYRIASGFRTSVDLLVAANPGFTVNSVLSQGQPVNIPPFDASCGSGTAVSGFPTDGVTSCRAYRVKSGDSVYSIALAFATSGANIVAANPELNDPSRLAPGNAIKIPPWDDSCSEEGILVDPSSANNTPSGTSALVPSTGTLVPNPAASSPVPVTPVTASPPRQVDTGAPTSAQAPAIGPAPGASTAANATIVNQLKSKVEMLISGVSNDEFALKQQSVVSAVATAAKVPTTSVSITFVVPATSPSSGRRMLLISSNAVKVQSIVTGDPVAVQNNLLAAQRAGTLSAAFTVEGMALDMMTMIDPLGKITPIVTSASSSDVADSSTTDSESSLPLPMGVLIGISVGAVALIVALTAIGCCVSKRRKRRQQEENAGSIASAPASKRYAGVNAYVTTSSLRDKYYSDELKDCNGGNGNTKQQRGGSGGGYPSSSPNRSPRRGPGSNRSTTRGSSRQLNMSDAYVISTTVSNTPKVEDDVRVEVPSRPPSSATSVADMLVDEYRPLHAPLNMLHAPTVPVVVMLPAQQQQYQQRQQVAIETTGSSSPKESVAEASYSSYASDTVEEYEGEQYYLAAAPAAPVGRPASASAGAQIVVKPLPSVRDGSFKRNPFPRAVAQPEEFSVAAVQSKTASYRISNDYSPTRNVSASLSPSTKHGYVSPYSQNVISGQVSLPRSPSRTAAGGGAGRVAAKVTTTTTVGAGASVGSPVRASGGYVSPYSQQKLRSPQRSPTRKAAHERLSAYAEM